MKDLIEFVKKYSSRYGFIPDEALDAAQDAKLIKSYQRIDSDITNERRWGHDEETVYRVDDGYILFDVYVMTGDEGEDELNYVYEVKPFYDLKTIWKIVEENKEETREDYSDPLTLGEFKKGIRGIPDGYDDYHIDHMASMLSRIIDHVEEKSFLMKDDLIKMIDDEVEFTEDYRSEG